MKAQLVRIVNMINMLNIVGTKSRKLKEHLNGESMNLGSHRLGLTSILPLSDKSFKPK